MELSTQEAEIPMPLNSVYGGVHAHVNAHVHGPTHAHQGNMTHHVHHHHHHQDQPSSTTTSLDNHHTNGMPIPITTIVSNSNNNGKANNTTLKYHEEEQNDEQEVPYNNKDTTNNPTIIRYRECQKNHAASIGGKALDGCGEFMPSGDEGTIEALICSACTCHRNFHRKEIDGHFHNHNQYPYPHHFYLPSPHPHPQSHPIISTRDGRKVVLRSGNSGGGGNSSSGGFLGYPMSRALPINVSYQMGLGGRVAVSEEQEHEDDHGRGGGGGGGGGLVMRNPLQMKRRVRTKFSQEQKEKMLEFAEKVGWKIQKIEDSVVQQFCQEIGIKRRVLKVWMHNNKHSFAKKCIDNHIPNTNNDNSTTTSNLFN